MKSDRRFQQFIHKCSENPLLKKKGVPECIMFVTGRIMKYPLLVDALIKTAKDRPADEEQLIQAKMFVKVNNLNVHDKFGISLGGRFPKNIYLIFMCKLSLF